MICSSRITATLTFLALLAAAPSAYSAENDLVDIKAEVAKQHDEAVERLADWIKQLSIAAEDRGFPEGVEHMAQLVKEAGFQHVQIVQTEEKRGMFATRGRGHADRVLSAHAEQGRSGIVTSARDIIFCDR